MYKDLRGDAAKPIYSAFGFEGRYSGEHLAEIRIKDSGVRIDAHGEGGFRFLDIGQDATTLGEVDGTTYKETKLFKDGRLTIETAAFSHTTGVNRASTKNITPEQETSLKAEKENLSAISLSVYSAAKEYIETNKFQPLGDKVASIPAAAADKPKLVH